MSQLRFAQTTALCLLVAAPCATVDAGTSDVAYLLRLMPAKAPASVVIVDLEKLDKSMSALRKRFDPASTEPGPLAELKNKVGVVVEWADLSQPIGIAAADLSTTEDRLLWLWVPGFANRAKRMDGATEESGVWTLPVSEDKTLFAKTRGEYVLVANSKETLATGLAPAGKTLLDRMQPRIGLAKDRDVVIHMDFDPLRPQVLAGVAQASQMAPMMAMMLTQGGDPTAMTAFLTAAVQGTEKLVEQIAYIELGLALGEEAANVTLLTGFAKGPIREYLGQQKPAGFEPFAKIPERPFALAISYHSPGGQWPAIDYFFDQASSAIQPSPIAGTPVDTDAAKKAMAASRDLYRSFEGFDMVMSMSSERMRMLGDYISQDPEALLSLVKQSLSGQNPLMKQFKPGVMVEALEPRKIGRTNVQEYAVRVDETNPTAAQMLALYGENPRSAIGAMGRRLRFCTGSEEDVNQAFSGRVESPFTSGQFVQGAIAELPARRNALILVDPAGLLPMLGPLMGGPKVSPVPPGPPIAISVSLVGNPARVDLHVPFQAIERVRQATMPEEPQLTGPEEPQ